MQVNVAFAFNASAQTTGGGAAAVQYHLRYMTVSASAVSPRAVYDDFAVPPSQPWTAAGADTVGGVSATCYYSALSLLAARPAADAGVVLGLVISPWGGTPIKAHVPLSVNATCGALYPYSGGRNGDCGLDHAPCNVSAIFNAMLAPLAGPMGRPLASLLWFQGENDALATEQGLAYYACSLAALAAALRAAFASPNAHWVTFQLAAYNGGPALAPFRRMQCATTYADIPNSSCVVLADDGDWASPIGSVHSRNKQLVGRRAGAALADAIYGVPQPTRGRGPTFVSQELASAPDGTLTATVSIDPATLGPAGLIYSPPSTSPWSNATRCPLESGIFKLSDCGFLTIVTAAGAQLNATAAVDASGTKLILTASAGAGQTAVGTTHGWGAWPVINYYNEFGLPLVPWNVTGAA